MVVLWLFAVVIGMGASSLRGTEGSTPPNILLIVVDNMRPSMGAYSISDVHTPHMDTLAGRSTLFARAYCQLAWCSPSRNSFLVGRRPDITKVWNFVDNFREPGIGESWITLPEYFKDHGYYTTSVGKVFHPDLPPNYDYPRSWSDEVVNPPKPPCQYRTISCGEGPGRPFSDNETAQLAIDRLTAASRDPTTPFFAAVGFQSPRLPWRYPKSIQSLYPDPPSIPIAEHTAAPPASPWGWFRPVEINHYNSTSKVNVVSPMPLPDQHTVRRDYYASITFVDQQVGRVLATLDELGLKDNTAVILMADHGQNLGEHNMWAMMNNYETSLRVPLMMHVPWLDTKPKVYWHPVELVDIYPTLTDIAGLPPPPSHYHLDGTSLFPALINQSHVVKIAAIGQITRCHNCSAYQTSQHWDLPVDAAFACPCVFNYRTDFDTMGYSVRTTEWRYTLWCGWNGTGLTVNWSDCPEEHLFDHRTDDTLYDVDRVENTDVKDNPKYSDVLRTLRRILKDVVGPH